jgi:hypothetical protein
MALGYSGSVTGRLTPRLARWPWSASEWLIGPPLLPLPLGGGPTNSRECYAARPAAQA